MDQSNPPNVLSLRSRLKGRAPAPILAAVSAKLVQARDAIDAALAGDVDMVFSAHREINRAVGIVLDNRLSSSWPNCPTCPNCGAEWSYGRCWGCGAPPRDAS